MSNEPKPTRVVIATPLYGPPTTASVSCGYHLSLLQLIKDPGIEIISSYSLSNCDLVRARSRAVRTFLDAPEATHLLFWDADVVPRDLRCVRAMVDANKPVIALHYPRKMVDWRAIEAGVRDEAEMAKLGRQTAEEIEQLGYTYPMHTGPNGEVSNNIGEVNAIGCGFMLIQRHALEAMIDRYRTELGFIDEYDGNKVPTVALFQLLIENGTLLHEDYSFCTRWRAMGGKIHVFLDPASHIGNHEFRGHVSGLLR